MCVAVSLSQLKACIWPVRRAGIFEIRLRTPVSASGVREPLLIAADAESSFGTAPRNEAF